MSYGDTIEMNYQEKLQDPRWERFRAEVLEYWNYTCVRCRRYESQTPLQVHHPFYRKNAEPWDYDPGEVRLLCIPCHKKAHGIVDLDDDSPF